MFRKGTYEPWVAIAVTLKTRPADEYIFHFPKVLPQAALDAQQKFLGEDAEESKENARLNLIKTVAVMLLKDPDGFGDYPATEGTVESRALNYFNDPREPELEDIISQAWVGYVEVKRPTAYLKRLQDSRAADGQPSDVPAQTPSGV